MKFNNIVAKLLESETLRLNTLAQKLAAEGKKIFNLTAGELDFSTPKSIQQAVRRHLQENKYTPVLGFEHLRQVIASCAAKAHGAKSLTQANIAVTAGAKQGLSEILQVILNRGDEVIIPVPAWPSYEHQVRLAGGRPVFAPLSSDFSLDAKKIKSALTSKTKAVILNFPHNPTGRVFSEPALKRLAKLLAKRQIYIIADMIYSSLVYKGRTPKPAQFFKKNLILVDGFSKSHALTGWRIGYVAAAPNIINALGRFQSHTSGNTSVLSQWAGYEALFTPEVTKRYLAVLKKRRELVEKALKHIPRIDFSAPDGAFYFFLDISGITRDSAKFCQKLLQKTGVALVPGEAFRAPGFARLSFTAPETALREGVRRFAKFVKLY